MADMYQTPDNNTVPWRGLDVLLFLFLWLAAQTGCGIGAVIAYHVVPNQAAVQKVEMNDQKHDHPITSLIALSKNSPFALLIVFLTIVVSAPLLEELLFRLLFQGWLESQFAKYQIPGGSVPAIGIVSCIFASLHITGSETMDARWVLFMCVGILYANILVFTLGILYLIWVRNVKMTYLFFGTRRFSFPQLFTIAGCCFIALVITLGISAIMESLCPNMNTDPIPIFFLSLAFGALYSITRNLSYCILFHAFFNLTSLTIAWFTV